MSWEGFMQMERTQLRERREGKLRRALGPPLPGESVEQLDRIGNQDRLRAEQGLVAVVGESGRISYKHIDDLSSLDMHFRTAAEWVQVGWLKERIERRRRGAGSPPIPQHLG
jgi:succinyl-CoA synthetase alpha subunit